MKPLRFLAALALLLFLFPGTARAADLNILATTFPVWLFTREVTQDVPGIALNLMIPATAGCPHDYVLTPQDMRKLGQAEVLVLNGLGLDHFALDAASAADAGSKRGGKLRLVDASAGLSEYLRDDAPPTEGDSGHVHAHGPECDHGHDLGFNPHYFASPLRAAEAVLTIGASLADIDPAHAAAYQQNAAAYAHKLQNLAATLRAELQTLARPILVQHSSFAYLAHDAGLDIAGVIQAHEGQEPSAARLLQLNSLIREKGIAAVFTEPQYPARAAETLARENKIPLASLDPLANGPENAPLGYYQMVMAKNIQTLVDTLNAD